MRRFLFFSGFQPRKEEDSGHGWLVGAVSVPIGSGGFRSSHGLSPHEARHDSFPQRPLPLQRVAGKLSQASHHSNLFKENEGQLRTKRQLLTRTITTPSSEKKPTSWFNRPENDRVSDDGDGTYVRVQPVIKIHIHRYLESQQQQYSIAAGSFTDKDFFYKKNNEN